MNIKIRRDTEDNWKLYNPILAEKELCYDKTYDKYKIGNGIDNWNNLNYTDLNKIESFIIRGIENGYLRTIQINMK